MAAARAGGRTFTKEDSNFIRTTFLASQRLDEDGVRWLGSWIGELCVADPVRLSPDRVARRLQAHVAEMEVDALLLWLMRGAAEVWVAEASAAWVDALATAMGVDPAHRSGLWAESEGKVPTLQRLAALKTLGLRDGASQAAIRAAWLTMAHRYLPDRADGDVVEATRVMARVNAAYALLKE